MRNRNFNRGNLNRRNFNHESGDWMFKVVPWIIGIGFVVVITVIAVQFVVIGWAGYHAVTDPEGAANFVGTIVGEAVRPVAEAIKGE
jgi:hypothetical protein